MKKRYVVGVIIVVLFGSILAFTIHVKTVANHYAGYINERLNNLIKPTEGDISKADKIIKDKDILKSKQISTDDIKNLDSLYKDAAFNLQDLQEIELFVTGNEKFGEQSKTTLFSIQGSLQNMQSKDKVVELNNDQVKLFQEISKMNRDLLTIFKSTLEKQYKVNEDQWIAVLKQMDNVTQIYYGLF